LVDGCSKPSFFGRENGHGIPVGDNVEMARLSSSQERIITRMRAGARLAWNSDLGKYRMVDGPILSTVDPRTVDALVKAGIIEKDIVGGCRVSEQVRT
jgi:hypothetical protein